MRNAGTTPQTVAHEQGSDRQRRLCEKAQGVLRPLLEWLESRGPDAKLTAILRWELLRCQSMFAKDGTYPGDVGQDLFDAFRRDVLVSSSADEREHFARGFAAALRDVEP